MTNIFNEIKEKDINTITLTEVKYLIKYTESLEQQIKVSDSENLRKAIETLQSNYDTMNKRDFNRELSIFFERYNSGLLYGDE